MSKDPAQRVLIVEDDEETGALLRLYLEDAGYLVFHALRGDEGLDVARRRRPDVVLLDIMLPGMSGWEVCERLRSESDVPIMLLTARTLEEERLRGFDLGADDYVSKPFSPREVTRRVRALLRRTSSAESSDANGLLTFEALELDGERMTLFVGDAQVSLTATEFRILAVLMRWPRRVHTREELIEAAFGREFDGQLRTVDAHVGNLRRKLTTDDQGARYVQTVIGVGYRLAPDE